MGSKIAPWYPSPEALAKGEGNFLLGNENWLAFLSRLNGITTF